MPDVFGKMPPKDMRTARVMPGRMPPKMKPGHMPTSLPMRTANWPGLPGKMQKGDRGPRNVRQSPMKEGL